MLYKITIEKKEYCSASHNWYIYSEKDYIIVSEEKLLEKIKEILSKNKNIDHGDYDDDDIELSIVNIKEFNDGDTI